MLGNTCVFSVLGSVWGDINNSCGRIPYCHSRGPRSGDMWTPWGPGTVGPVIVQTHWASLLTQYRGVQNHDRADCSNFQKVWRIWSCFSVFFLFCHVLQCSVCAPHIQFSCSDSKGQICAIVGEYTSGMAASIVYFTFFSALVLPWRTACKQPVSLMAVWWMLWSI